MNTNEKHYAEDDAPAWGREVGRLTYPGDVVEALLADPIKGPIVGGEMVTVYEATHDPASNTTVALFRYTTTQDMEAHVARMVASA